MLSTQRAQEKHRPTEQLHGSPDTSEQFNGETL